MRATGWTLAQVDGLSLAEWARYLQIVDGENKAAAAPGNRRPASTGKRRRGS